MSSPLSSDSREASSDDVDSSDSTYTTTLSFVDRRDGECATNGASNTTLISPETGGCWSIDPNDISARLTCSPLLMEVRKGDPIVGGGDRSTSAWRKNAMELEDILLTWCDPLLRGGGL
jgi:hypothetical protein